MSSEVTETRVKKVTKPKIQLDLKEVEDLAAQGLSQVQIALNLGVCESTLQKNKRENADFAAAITRGRATGEQKVSSALFKAATGGHVEAAKFYLARRCDWRETTNSEITGKDGAPIAHAVSMVISKDDAEL